METSTQSTNSETTFSFAPLKVQELKVYFVPRNRYNRTPGQNDKIHRARVIGQKMINK